MDEEEFSSVVDEMTDDLPELLGVAESADFELETSAISETSCSEGVTGEGPGAQTRLEGRFVSPVSSAEQAEQILDQFEESWPEMGWDVGEREDRSDVKTRHEVTRIGFQRNWGNSQEYTTQAIVIHEIDFDGERQVAVVLAGACATHDPPRRHVERFPLESEED